MQTTREMKWARRAASVTLAFSLVWGCVGCGGSDSSGDDPGGFDFSGDAGGSGSGGTATGGTTTGGSGSGGGTGSDFDSSVDDDRTASELDQDETEQVCREASKWAESQISREQICLLSAHINVAFQRPSSDDEAQKLCAQAQEDCTGDFDGDGDACDGLSANDCDAKVSTIEQCYEDRVESFVQTASQLPACTEVSASFYDDISGTSFLPEPSEVCRRLQRKCPDFFARSIGGT